MLDKRKLAILLAEKAKNGMISPKNSPPPLLKPVTSSIGSTSTMPAIAPIKPTAPIMPVPPIKMPVIPGSSMATPFSSLKKKLGKL